MITSKQVTDFKESFCNENKLIPNILKNDFKDSVEFPLLDVGSGLGDISSVAFENSEVIHLDTEDYSFYKIPEKHTRIIGDFFTFLPNIKIKTILLSHILQFIDEDISKLNQKIQEINPDNIIVVRNTNNDFMGDIMKWFDEQNINSNPEKIIDNFPISFVELKKVSFVADLICPDFKILSEQISYLWDVKLSNKQLEFLVEFLETKLSNPSFQIHQEIMLYVK